jgi:SlyX protein
LPRVKEKIIDLETKFSFQEDLLQQLNKEMLLQQRQIDALSLQLRLVREQLSELLVQDGVHYDQPLEDEKPPHY